MRNTLILTEDEFEIRFQPETYPDGSLYVQREWHTFEEQRLLEAMHQQRRLWTAIEGDAGNFGIVQGYAMVNRLFYIICEVPYGEHDVIEVTCELTFCTVCGSRFEDGGQHENAVIQSELWPELCEVCQETRAAHS